MNFFHLSPEKNVVLALKMDLEKIRRFANSEFESWKIAKAVTEIKNEIKDAEQGRDVVMSDVFKTLRDPLIEQQKKTDAKQDAVIEQLRENQLALTGGFKDLVESNRDVLTLQQELPFPGGMEALPFPPTSPEPQLPTSKKEVPQKVTSTPKPTPTYDLNKPYSKDELGFLRSKELPSPNGLVKLTKEERIELRQNVIDLRNAYSKQIGAIKRMKKPEPGDLRNMSNLEGRRDLLNRYIETISMVAHSTQYKTGTGAQGAGIRKYKQPKRNAYKIKDSSFGTLSVDVPKLKNEMKLNVFRGGKLIYRADADKSLVDLLTKRFNPRSSYSLNAVKIFNDLNLLANLPRHPSSGKSKLLGSGVVFYKDPKELAGRMKILVGSMAAGNNSPVIKNDLSMINDELLKIGAITPTTHEKFYKKYIK